MDRSRLTGHAVPRTGRARRAALLLVAASLFLSAAVVRAWSIPGTWTPGYISTAYSVWRGTADCGVDYLKGSFKLTLPPGGDVSVRFMQDGYPGTSSRFRNTSASEGWSAWVTPNNAPAMSYGVRLPGDPAWLQVQPNAGSYKVEQPTVWTVGAVEPCATSGPIDAPSPTPTPATWETPPADDWQVEPTPTPAYDACFEEQVEEGVDAWLIPAICGQFLVPSPTPTPSVGWGEAAPGVYDTPWLPGYQLGWCYGGSPTSSNDWGRPCAIGPIFRTGSGAVNQFGTLNGQWEVEVRADVTAGQFATLYVTCDVDENGSFEFSTSASVSVNQGTNYGPQFVTSNSAGQGGLPPESDCQWWMYPSIDDPWAIDIQLARFRYLTTNASPSPTPAASATPSATPWVVVIPPAQVPATASPSPGTIGYPPVTTGPVPGLTMPVLSLPQTMFAGCTPEPRMGQVAYLDMGTAPFPGLSVNPIDWFFWMGSITTLLPRGILNGLIFVWNLIAWLVVPSSCLVDGLLAWLAEVGTRAPFGWFAQIATALDDVIGSPAGAGGALPASLSFQLGWLGTLTVPLDESTWLGPLADYRGVLGAGVYVAAVFMFRERLLAAVRRG